LLWFPNLEMDQSIWVENAGFYSLKASDTNGCVSFSDTIAINVRDSELELSETDSILICEGESVELTVLDPPLADIIWSNGIPSEISIDLTEAGLYYASAIDSTGCGLWSDTISLNVIKKPLTPTISDTSICWGQSILFSDNDTNYLFLKELGSTQTLDSGITIRYEPNKLESSFLIWSQNGHCLSDLVSFDVMLANCDLEIPNVISPNHDGLNDYFEIENCPDSCFSLQIFNRWGTLVFESNSPNIKWDGHVSSSGVSSVGVYFYSLQYCSDSQHNKHGSFTLLR
jgi:gliding motility-associated-like protein